MGFILEWNYNDGYVDISMPGYVDRLQTKLQHIPSTSPQYSPHECINIKWSRKGDRQYTQREDTSPMLSPKQTKWIQSAIGSLLYYGRAIDSTILPALAQISTQQATPTINTKKALQRLLDYVNTYNKTSVRFYNSDMVLTKD